MGNNKFRHGDRVVFCYASDINKIFIGKTGVIVNDSGIHYQICLDSDIDTTDNCTWTKGKIVSASYDHVKSANVYLLKKRLGVTDEV